MLNLFTGQMVDVYESSKTDDGMGSNVEKVAIFESNVECNYNVASESYKVVNDTPQSIIVGKCLILISNIDEDIMLKKKYYIKFDDELHKVQAVLKHKYGMVIDHYELVFQAEATKLEEI